MTSHNPFSIRRRWIKLWLVGVISLTTTGCVGTVVGAVVDTAVEVIKVPFKVGGAVIDVMTPDDYNDSYERDDERDDKDANAAAVRIEQEGI